MHTSYETILLQHFLDMRHYYTLESYKDPIYNKYKKWMVSSYIGHPILYQIKSLLLSHHHSSSALVSEILMSVLQTVQKKQQTIYIWTDSAKKKTALEHLQCSRQCKKTTTTIYIWTDSAKKLHWSIYSAPDSAKKTTTIYIWTVHIYRLYRRQCAKYIYSVDRGCALYGVQW